MKNYARTVGVFFGSDSAEHKVSVSTARKVANQLIALGFNVVGIYLNKDLSWSISGLSNDKNNSFEKLLKVDDNHKWKLDLGVQGKLSFSTESGFLKKEEKVIIDIAFPSFHGLNGEDGTFQGLCDLFRVPCVGAGQASSVLTMDKVLTKDVFNSYDLPTKPFVFFTKTEWLSYKNELTEAINSLDSPVYVKPARIGSSLGISKVDVIDKLDKALEMAFQYDNKVLIEESVKLSAELVISVTGNYFDQDNIQLSSTCLYDDNQKEYRSFKTNESELQKLNNLARRIFIAFELTGICQIDLIRNQKTREVYITEIDAMPHDCAFGIWEQSGVKPGALLRELIRLADQVANNKSVN